MKDRKAYSEVEKTTALLCMRVMKIEHSHRCRFHLSQYRSIWHSMVIILMPILLLHHLLGCGISKDIDRDDNSPLLSDKKYCLWLCKSGWDSEFIQELFPPPVYDHISLSNFLKYHNQSHSSTAFKPKALVYNIENAHTDALHEETISLIKRFKPAILVHLSDEWGGDSGRRWRYRLGSSLYSMAPLALRSYSVHPYRNSETHMNNVMQLPLGYISGMLNVHTNETDAQSKMSVIDAVTFSTQRQSNQRNFSWSFVGGLKGHKERYHAIEVFNKWQPSFVSHAMASHEMRGIYNNSKFVLVGRGQSNLDCFRIYEALICGAIPIVVGPAQEIKNSFEFEGDTPPFFFADSYETALIKAQSMDDHAIDVQRGMISQWFVNRFQLLRRRIDHWATFF